MHRDEIRSRIASFPHWYHQIEVAPGVVTPGSNASRDSLERLEAIGLPKDAAGLRVLDVGSRDGFFAFEMERRGARVVAVDHARPEATGFSIAAGILESRVTFQTANVYDLTPEMLGTFDLVLFLGILYHLRNPMRALDRVARLLKPGGLAFVETQVTTNPALASLDSPAWEFFPGGSLHGDQTNKWAPNLPGLCAVLEECELHVLDVQVAGDRAVAAARLVPNHNLRFFAELDAGLRLGA